MTSPCHPVEKDVTNGNKVETKLHCITYTSNPLGKQHSLSIHEIKATDGSKYCYLLTGDTISSTSQLPQTFTRAQNI